MNIQIYQIFILYTTALITAAVFIDNIVLFFIALLMSIATFIAWFHFMIDNSNCNGWFNLWGKPRECDCYDLKHEEIQNAD